MSDREEKIKRITEYFEKRDDVVMAFLFGSRAKGGARAASDWDIGVYFKPEVQPIEWEEHNREYPEEPRVWGDCVDILQTDNIDIVVLNRAPAHIADSALAGTPLVVKDRALWLEFMLIITREAEDFYDFSRDYYEITQRSASLSKKDAHRLERTIIFLQEQMSLYGYFRSFSSSDYTDNIHKRGEVERWVENIMNPIIEISKIVLASEKKLMPSSYRESIERAGHILHVSESSIEKLRIWISLRNVLAHEYLDIKWKKIVNFINESEPCVKQFVDATKAFLQIHEDKKEDKGLF